jgi:SAM-dependent methyltransferase
MPTAVAIAGTSPGRAHLPARYHQDWQEPFFSRIQAELRPGMAVLDVGSGRHPAISRESMPGGVRYVGLDISESELRTAPTGSYDELSVGDIIKRQPHLEGQFDLAVSWQVLEHVKPMGDALENIRHYLKPGGRFVGHLSGKFSLFGLANQVVPPSLGPRILKALLHRDPETVFPAYYHDAWHSKLQELMAPWTVAEVEPRFNGAVYLRFSALAQRAYVLFENWASEGHHDNLATHYLVDARR